MPGPSSVSLSDYLTAVRNLVHDANDVYTTQAQKIQFINEAIQQRDIATGGRRVIGTFTLTTGVTTYSYTTLSAATGLNTANIFDIIGITLIYTGYRILLEKFSYSEMVSQPGYLAYTLMNDRPAGWAPYGDQNIVIGPPPSQAYQIEIDCTVYSTPTVLSGLTDTDNVQFPYTYPVARYAAYLIKINEQSYDEADFFKGLYAEAIDNINAYKTGTVPSMYPRGTTRAG